MKYIYEGESKMLNLIKKGMYLGIGLFSLTKEKAERFVDELIKSGEASLEEKNTLIQNLLDEAQKQKDILEKKINEEIKRAIEKVGIPTRKDIEKLEKKIDELYKKSESKK